MAGDESGIPVGGADSDSDAGPGAGPGWLSGEQAKSVIGSMEKAVSTAQKAPGVIREANRLAAAQRQREAARAVSGARGAGVATGGGLAGASGTTALTATREAQAQAVLAAQEAQKAEQDAAGKEAQMSIDVAAIKKKQQSVASSAVNAMIADQQLYTAGQDKPYAEAAANIVASHMSGLDLTEPFQLTAAAEMLLYWLGQREESGLMLGAGILENAKLIMQYIGPEAAIRLGGTIKSSEVKSGFSEDGGEYWLDYGGNQHPYDETMSPAYVWDQMLQEAQAAAGAAAQQPVP